MVWMAMPTGLSKKTAGGGEGWDIPNWPLNNTKLAIVSCQHVLSSQLTFTSSAVQNCIELTESSFFQQQNPKRQTATQAWYDTPNVPPLRARQLRLVFVSSWKALL